MFCHYVNEEGGNDCWSHPKKFVTLIKVIDSGDECWLVDVCFQKKKKNYWHKTVSSKHISVLSSLFYDVRDHKEVATINRSQVLN